jgi:hypothetical protein
MAQEEKYLDDIGEAPAAEPAAAEAPQSEPEAPEPEAEHETRPEGDDRPKRTDTRPEGYVTKGERDRIASELQAERQQRANFEKRYNDVIERFFKQQQEPEQVDDPKPDPRQDPIGHMEWKERQEAKAAEEQKTRQEQWAKQQEEARQFEDTLNRSKARFAKVASERPEVAQLYSAVQHKVADIYREQGVPMHQIPGLVQQYEADVIKWARQEYIPIEDALEATAKRFGLQMPTRAAAPAKPTPERDPATGQWLPSEAEKAAKQRESQERNSSLSSAPGAPVKKMTGTELAKMSEEDQWKYLESVLRKPGAKQFERDMGFR